MKKIIPLILSAVLFFFFFACHKDHTPIPPKSTLIIQGTAVNCAVQPIDTGYVVVSVDDTSYRFPVGKGAFSASIEREDTATVRVLITLFDLVGGNRSYDDTLYAGTGTHDIGRLVACKPDQWVTIAGLYYGVSFSDVSPPNQVEFSGNDSNTLIYASNLTSGHPEFYLFLPGLKGTGPVIMREFHIYLNSSERYKGYNLACTITSYGSEGGYITGTYSGNVRFDGGDFETNPDIMITGDFQVRR